MIIDAHLHISYMGVKKQNMKDIIKNLKKTMKTYKIDYAIAIPDNVPNPQCADMPTLLELIENETQFLGLGTINIFKNIPKQINLLKNLFINQKILGVKLFPGHDPFYPTDKRCYPVYELCNKFDYPVVIHTGANSKNNESSKYNDPKYIVKIADKFPNLKIIICHYYWPKMEYCYEISKNYKNIYYDTSAMADDEVAENSGGWDKVLNILKKTIKTKPNNIIFGTDWPMCPIDKHIKMIKDLKLNSIIEEKIFCLNAIDVYKLNIS